MTVQVSPGLGTGARGLCIVLVCLASFQVAHLVSPFMQAGLISTDMTTQINCVSVQDSHWHSKKTHVSELSAVRKADSYVGLTLSPVWFHGSTCWTFAHQCSPQPPLLSRSSIGIVNSSLLDPRVALSKAAVGILVLKSSPIGTLLNSLYCRAPIFGILYLITKPVKSNLACYS